MSKQTHNAYLHTIPLRDYWSINNTNFSAFVLSDLGKQNHSDHGRCDAIRNIGPILNDPFALYFLNSADLPAICHLVDSHQKFKDIVASIQIYCIHQIEFKNKNHLYSSAHLAIIYYYCLYLISSYSLSSNHVWASCAGPPVKNHLLRNITC